MKKLHDLKLATWFENKQDGAFMSASVNPRYGFEVVKMTEKAIQIHIQKEDALLVGNWLMWIPKSVIEGGI